jgi:hypothetical protein
MPMALSVSGTSGKKPQLHEDNMADLLDIAASTTCEVVKIDGKRYVVRGLNGPAIASIVSRFPRLVLLLGSGALDNNWPQLIGQLGNAIGPIIAAGCGYLEDEEREKAANNRPLQDQLKFLKAIWGLTFPLGLASFVEEITNVVGAMDEGATAKVFKVRLRKSPSPSQPSSDVASRPTMQ